MKVFKGNKQDPQTVFHQIEKLSKSFGVKEVLFVGDRGMIKIEQIKNIHKSKERDYVKN